MEHVITQCTNLVSILHFASLQNCEPMATLDIFFELIQKSKVDFLEAIKDCIKKDIMENTREYRCFF